MSGFVDRVAEAIALSGNGGSWDDWYNHDQKEFHRKRARAALQAMREPTDTMKSAGCKMPIYHCWGNNGEYTDAESAEQIFSQMIDEAMK